MADRAQAAPPAAVRTGIFGGKGKEILQDGVYKMNPVTHQVLGICIFLAVTTRVANSLVMGAALIFVLAMSNLMISSLRFIIPRRIRMITEVAVIATFVIILDQFLKAFYFDMSKQLGPYVALIITNCIVMGRAEAYAMQNPPLMSVLDGVANGIGYALILVLIGTFRELLGSGTILGSVVLPETWYPRNLIFVLAPGAFFAAGFLVWFLDTINPPQVEGEETGGGR